MAEVQDMVLSEDRGAVSHYPEMLQEHDLVVASLNELLEVKETVFYIPQKWGFACNIRVSDPWIIISCCFKKKKKWEPP